MLAPFPVLNANLAGNYMPGNPITTTKWNHAALLKLTSVLNPHVVNEFHVAYQRYDVLNSIGTPFTNSQVGIRNLEPAIDIALVLHDRQRQRRVFIRRAISVRRRFQE